MIYEINIIFNLYDLSTERIPIDKFVEQLSIKPDSFWSASEVHPKQQYDGFLYQWKSPDGLFGDYIENEILILLRRIIQVAEEISENYCSVLDIVVYTEGQTNPGIHINNESLQLLSHFKNNTISLDLYATSEDSE